MWRLRERRSRGEWGNWSGLRQTEGAGVDRGEREELGQTGVGEDQRDYGHPRISCEDWAGLGDAEAPAVSKDMGLR